jgi:uncharacterized glyoxalase superfamily protein PhnB
MKMENTTLCFWSGIEAVHEQPCFKRFPKDTPRGYGVEAVIMVDDIEDYCERVKEAANVVEPLVVRPWGSKDFRTADPFGYYPRFISKLNILDDTNAVE